MRTEKKNTHGFIKKRKKKKRRERKKGELKTADY